MATPKETLWAKAKHEILGRYRETLPAALERYREEQATTPLPCVR